MRGCHIRVHACTHIYVDLQVSRIGHAVIASLCVQCLSYPNAARCTLTAMSAVQGE